jgi:hypothetical protein
MAMCTALVIGKVSILTVAELRTDAKISAAAYWNEQGRNAFSMEEPNASLIPASVLTMLPKQKTAHQLSATA